MKWILALMTITAFNALAKEEVYCQVRFKCGLYQNEKLAVTGPCSRTNRVGKKTNYLFQNRISAYFDLEKEQDLKFYSTRQPKAKAFSRDDEYEWFYHIVQVENINQKKYKLKAGFLARKEVSALVPGTVEAEEYLSIGQDEVRQDPDHFIETIIDKDQVFEKDFDVNIILKSWGYHHKDYLQVDSIELNCYPPTKK